MRDILVALKQEHHPTEDYVRQLRRTLVAQFPGVTFYFLPADMVTQILNFGLPAPIDVQVEGNDLEASRQVADKLLSQFRQVPGLTDLRIQQPADQPKLHVTVDRTKAAQAGLTQRDVASSMLVTLSGSFQTQPTFWLNPQERRQLQRGGAGAAVQHAIAAGSAEHSRSRLAATARAGDSQQREQHLARQRLRPWSRTTTSAA